MRLCKNIGKRGDMAWQRKASAGENINNVASISAYDGGMT